MSFVAAVHAALVETDPAAKLRAVAALPEPEASPPADFTDDARVPGRPGRPLLVHPQQVPQRGFGSPAARAALVHAVAHIEFNAINLALDACWRFRGLPREFYRDWCSVAQDEARHFALLCDRLREFGHAYGDFEAHSGLWDAAEKTRHDVLVRMALVPRVLEARGLDVTPGIIVRLRQARDERTVAALQTILAEEVRHVAIGSHWFGWLCAQRGLDPASTFVRLLAEHGARVRAPVNREARLAAGFSAAELDGIAV
ncbi:MAG TPA: ferritin-like domain-containing protein [Candidatus Binatia bacterium]|nr:ferritin-like domain-containing protein [Candidatus Binatia bacterium]